MGEVTDLRERGIRAVPKLRKTRDLPAGARRLKQKAAGFLPPWLAAKSYCPTTNTPGRCPANSCAAPWPGPDTICHRRGGRASAPHSCPVSHAQRH